MGGYIKLQGKTSLDAAIFLLPWLLEPAEGPVEVGCLDLSVPTHQLLKDRVVDEHVLILCTEISARHGKDNHGVCHNVEHV